MAHQRPVVLTEGEGYFTWHDDANCTDIRVYYYLPDDPESLAADTQVVFVMHGKRRNAKKYRNDWRGIYETNDNFILLAPRFDTKQYPKAVGYNLGNMFSLPDLKRLNPRSRWAFTAIEGIFDTVKSSLPIEATRYYLYGHSAGSQFVHRMICFLPEARIEKAVAASAGSYFIPDKSAQYPRGLERAGGDPLPPVDLKKAFSTPMTVLLGGADTAELSCAHDSYECARKQGCNRLERGLNFFSAGSAAAKAESYAFNWRLKIVACAGQDDKRVLPCAALALEFFPHLTGVVCRENAGF